MDRPRIVITLAVARRQKEPEIAARKNELYLDGIRRHGGEPVPLDAETGAAARDETLASMDGLLLSGGADIEPSRYGQPNRGSLDIEPDRDALEAAAWAAARARSLPVLGICRGFQAINEARERSGDRRENDVRQPGACSADQLRRIPTGDIINEDQQRNRELIVNYIIDKTGAIEFIHRHGKRTSASRTIRRCAKARACCSKS